MKRIAFLLLFLPSFVFAQEADVMKPIHDLFAAMEKGDSAAAHRCFDPALTFRSLSTDASGKTVLRSTAMADFLKAIGTPHAEPFREKIGKPQVNTDGTLATVWVPYTFYLGTQLHHCGIDAFHLIKNSAGEWKIFHLADTRNTTGCKP